MLIQVKKLLPQDKHILLFNNVQGEKEAKDVHYEVGKKVRKAIADIGGMMPEEMPTPKKSLKELEREKKQLENKVKYIYIDKDKNVKIDFKQNSRKENSIWMKKVYK